MNCLKLTLHWITWSRTSSLQNVVSSSIVSFLFPSTNQVWSSDLCGVGILQLGSQITFSSTSTVYKIIPFTFNLVYIDILWFTSLLGSQSTSSGYSPMTCIPYDVPSLKPIFAYEKGKWRVSQVFSHTNFYQRLHTDWLLKFSLTFIASDGFPG